MTDYYVRWDIGSDANDGLSWANAKKYLHSVMNGTLAVTGDQIFVAGQLTEAGADRTFFGAGTASGEGIYVYGVDDTETLGASDEPPPASKLIQDRFDPNIPSYETTLNNADFFFQDYAYVWGVKFKPSQSFKSAGVTLDAAWTFEQCLVEVAGSDAGGIVDWRDERGDKSLVLIDTDVTFPNTGTAFRINSGYYRWSGGKLIASAGITGGLIDVAHSNIGSCCIVEFEALDLSEVGSGNDLVDSVINCAADLSIMGCELPTNYGLPAPSDFDSNRARVRVDLSDAGTVGAGLVQNFEEVSVYGQAQSETTVVRTGGAEEEGTSIAQRMIINTSGPANRDGGCPLQSRRLFGYVDNTGSATTFTAYINNQANPAADLDDDQAYMDLFYPGQNSTQLVMVTTKLTPLTTPTALADDTSAWGGGDSNAQKIAITTDGSTIPHPHHKGTCYAIVYYANGDATPEDLFVDNKLYVS